MNKTTLFLLLTVAAVPAFSMQRIWGYCQRGAAPVVAPSTVGGSPTLRNFQQSFPACTLTVLNLDSSTATIYSANSTSSPLANPFTANNQGYFEFYAPNGRVNVQLSGSGIGAPFTWGDILLADFNDGFGVLSGGWNGTAYVNEIITSPAGRSIFQAPLQVGPLPLYCVTPTPGPCPGQPVLTNAAGAVVAFLGYDPAYPLQIPNVTGPPVNLPILIGRDGATTNYSMAYSSPNFPRVWAENPVAFKTVTSASQNGYVQAIEASTSNFTNEYGAAQGPLGAGSLVGIRSNYVGSANLAGAAFSSQNGCGTVANCGFAAGIWLDGLVTRLSTATYGVEGGTFISFHDDTSAGGGAGVGIDFSQVHGGYSEAAMLLPSIDMTSHIQSIGILQQTPTGIPYQFLEMDSPSNWLIAGASGQSGQTKLLGAEGGLELGFGAFPQVANWTGTFTTITGTTPGNPTILTIPAHGLTTGQGIFISGYTAVWATGIPGPGGIPPGQGVNGLYQITVVDSNNVSIAVNTTSYGAVTGTPRYLTGGTAQIMSAQRANTDLAGQITGTGAYTFSGTYSVPPVCTVSDASGGGTSPALAVSTTMIGISGTSGHVYDYICIGRN